MWGDTNEKRKVHSVAWDIMTRPKQLGGVGLRDLNVMNQVCLMQFGWKM